MVPGAGVEPARCYHRGILSPLRLPISPPGHLVHLKTYYFQVVQLQMKMEAEVGIEPAYTELQSAAWPLCHSALTILATNFLAGYFNLKLEA